MKNHEVLNPVAVSEAPAAVIENTSILDKLRGTRLGNALAIGGAALAIAGGEAINADKAEASAASPAEITNVTTTQTVLVGKSKSSAKALAKAYIMGNHRTVAKAQVKEDMAEGRCDYFTGKEARKAGLQTQGYNGSGVGYAPENRNSHFCDSDGDGDYDYRAECGNKAIQRKPKPQEHVIWVNNFNKAKLVVKSKSVAEAETSCELRTDSGVITAHAYGRGVGKGRAAIKIKNAYGAKGKGIEKVIAKSATKANAMAYSKAKAQAEVSCVEQGGVPVPPTPPEQHKDGTQTPQPPVIAPGPNPAPSPEEPYPGGYQCYSETTGAPVTPRDDGTCPAGSVGA